MFRRKVLYLLAAASIVTLSSSAVAGSNTYRASFGSALEIEAGSKGLAEPEALKTKNTFNFETDSWGQEGDYYWLDHGGNCGLTVSDTSVSATHGSSMCFRALGNVATQTYQEFKISPYDNFTISFNAYKSHRGSDYRANASMSGGGVNLFYWRYHRDGADYFSTPVGSVAINEDANRRYTVEKIGDRMRMYVDGTLVGEGQYLPSAEASYVVYLSANNSTMHMQNLEVNIY